MVKMMKKTKKLKKGIEKKDKLIKKVTEKMTDKIMPILQKTINKKKDYIGETFKVLKNLQNPKSKLAKKTNKICKEAVKESVNEIRKESGLPELKEKKEKITLKKIFSPLSVKKIVKKSKKERDAFMKHIHKKAIKTEDIPIPIPEQAEEIKKVEEENNKKYYKTAPLYWIKRMIFKKRFKEPCNHPKVFYKSEKFKSGFYRITICKRCYEILGKEVLTIDLKGE
jgi:hypothetical protein